MIPQTTASPITAVILNEEIQSLVIECAAGVNALMKMKEQAIMHKESKEKEG